MASNLAISVSANTAEARAQLSLVQADIRSLGTSMRRLASDARDSDIDGAVSGQLRNVAAQFEAARAEATKLNAELKGTVEGGFKEFGRAIREPLEGLAMMSSRMRETAELAGVMFAVDKMREWISSMGELGERTVNMAAAVGTTPHEFSLLSRALQLAGGDADTAGRTLERLGKNLQEALTTPTSTAAKAANSLAISHDQLRRASTDLSYALELLFNKFAEFADSPAKTADFLALMGRGMDQLVPAMRRGSAGFDELKQKAQETGTVLSNEDAEALDQTGEKVHLLAQTLEGEGVRGFLAIKDSIDSAIDGLTRFIKATGDAMLNFRNFMGQVASGEDLAAAVGAQAGAFLNAPPSPFTQSGATEGAAPGIGTDRDVSAGGAKPSVGQWPTTAAKGTKGAKGQASEVETWREQLQQQLEAEHNFFADSTAEELAFWQSKVNLTKAGSKERAEVETTIYGLEKRLAQQNERDQEDAINSAQRVSDAVYARKAAAIASELQLGKISAKTALADEQELLDQKWVLDQEYFAKKLTAAAGDVRNQQKINEEELIAHQRYLTEQQALDDKAAEQAQKAADKFAKPFIDAFNQIGSTFETVINGLIDKTMTWQSAMKSIFDSIIKSFTKMIGDMLSQWAASGLASMLGVSGTESGGGSLGIGGVLGQALGGLFKSGASSVGGGLFGSLFGGLGGAADQDFSGAVGGAVSSSGGGGLFSTLLSFLPFALPFLEKGGILPSAAGGWAVPSFANGGIPSILHGGEMVLPQNISQGLQGAINGGSFGGGAPNINISAVDAGSVARLFMSNGSALVAAINRASRFGTPLAQS